MTRRTLRPLAYTLVLIAVPSLARAQGFDASPSVPTPLPSDGLTIARPQVLSHGALGVTGTLSYAHEPLIERLRLTDGTSRENALVAHQLYAYFGLAYGLWDTLTLHATLPLAMVQSGSDPLGVGVTNAPSTTALGDLRLGARVRLLGGLEGDTPSRYGLSLDGAIFLPTGSRDAFTSDGKVHGEGTVVFEALATDAIYVGANAGVDVRSQPASVFANVGSSLRLAASAGYRTQGDRFRVGIEAGTRSHFDDVFAAEATGVETLGVASMRMLDGALIASIGAGPGFSSAPGTPDFRALARIGYAPTAKSEPVLAEPPPPPPDGDGDGIADAIDACPDVPGVAHDDPKRNGCPSDRDDDGIADLQDACPDVPGVSHDDPKRNGCPSDRDDDGVADAQDACPDVAGIESDDPKLHGCPPAKVTTTAIEITDKIHFEFGKAVLRSESDAVLRSIAKALKDNPDIEAVSIEGHTDEVGNDAVNLKLSQDRAAAVRTWLVANGIDGARLKTKGFGKRKPIADNATEEGREKNRRVEFRIEKRAGN